MPHPFPFNRFMQGLGRYSAGSVLTFAFHLPNLVRLSSRLLNDRRVPFHLKLLCYGAILYLLWPFDLIRDFMPYFLPGRIDDLVILFLAFRKLIKDSPQEVVEEHVRIISEKRRG